MPQLLKDGSHTSLRIVNQQKILSEIVFNGPVTRTHLTNSTGLTNASISRITKSLIDSGLIIESDTPVKLNGPGRRFVNLMINPSGGYVIGIKINALKQSIVVQDLSKKEWVKKELNIDSFSNPDEVVAEISKNITQLIDALNISQVRILGVACAITGAVDSENGILLQAPTLGGQEINIAEKLQKKLNLPIHLENLPNTINLCEHRFGATRNYNNVVAINAALGIGSSLIFDNRLVRGSTNTAGLLGELSFTDSGKFKNKTVDDLTAGWRVLGELNNQNYDRENHRSAANRLIDVLENCRDQDRITHKALNKAGESLGRFIEIYIAMTNPDAILLSGPLANNSAYLDGVKHRLDNNSVSSARKVKIVTSCITGSTAAGWLALNEFLVQRPIDLNQFTEQKAA